MRDRGDRGDTRRVVPRRVQHRITAADFGADGLSAHEAVGPMTDVRAVGPVLALHDATMEPGAGIGHHPHQRNERLFYVLSGALHHSDALSGREADARAGDLAVFTEGRRGMIHAESNPSADTGRQWILVVAPDEVPDRPRIQIIGADDAGRERQGEGTSLKVLVGGGSSAEPAADVRLLGDLRVRDDAVWRRRLAPDEAVIVQPIRGRALVMGEQLDTDDVIVVGPDDPDRDLVVTGDGVPTRALVAVTGPGYGLAIGTDPDPDRAPIPQRRSTGERRR